MKIFGKIKSMGATQADPNGKWEKTDMVIEFVEEFANQEPMVHELLATSFQPINREEVEKANQANTTYPIFLSFSVKRGVGKTSGKPFEIQDTVARFLSPIRKA